MDRGEDARAFCHIDQVFKDFLLSRIVEIGEKGPVTADPQADAGWHNEVVLEIGLHADLSDSFDLERQAAMEAWETRLLRIVAGRDPDVDWEDNVVALAKAR